MSIMKLDTVYIISYIDPKSKKYKTRSRAVIKQAEWLSQIPQVKYVFYIAQCWPKELKDTMFEIYNNRCKDVEFDYYDECIYTSKARNINLERFYNSDLGVTMFLDDDAVVNTYDKEMNYFEYFEKYIENSGIDWDYMGFKSSQYGNKNDGQFYFSKLDPWVWSGSTGFVMKNFKKFYNMTYYFNEDLNSLEDLEFGIRLNFTGHKLYLCENPYLHEVTTVSIMFDDKQNRKDRNLIARTEIARMWNERVGWEMFKLSSDGKLMQRKFRELYVKQPTVLINEDGSWTEFLK